MQMMKISSLVGIHEAQGVQTFEVFFVFIKFCKISKKKKFWAYLRVVRHFTRLKVKNVQQTQQKFLKT